ncbi:M42 family metallopeptidase [Sporanaerobacter acetigenes]|uniref:Putative aminopeptidase FrvX n=1 Tax=Sporanaerobacter acetigenes DSM 13106 TaxID=1123281 RepID=A0A1M5Z2F3_9FIRM|nr:M42 family metallopeptidase [Sporanaerobacter acetigenes]SHI18435.1 Putative aminopeptidase FrvX [Sporanaerobacter acetigenes DSM 13106]
MNIAIDNITSTLVDLLNIPSPTGNTKNAIDFVENQFTFLGIKTYRTNKGALIGTIEGKNTDKEVTLSGHVDTLGGMIKEIKSNGRVKITQIGGYMWNSIEGEHCTIEASNGKLYTGTILTTKASTHVHGGEASSLERNANNMEIRIDEKVKNSEDVEKLGISVGDYVFFDPRAAVTDSGFIKSRHLDDKAGVASILGIAKYLVENKITPNYTTNFFISNYEEVGHGASAAIPPKTFEFIAIDMAAPGEGQTSDEYSVTICAKDSSGPYDLELKKHLVNLAKENNLNYKVDIYPFYGSDGSATLRAGNDFKVGLIGPGVDASHSHERTHKEAIENTIKLGILYLTK